MQRVELPWLGTFDAWRARARELAGCGVPGSQIEWVMEGADGGLFCGLPDTGRDTGQDTGQDTGRGAAPRPLKVSKAFVGLAPRVIAHSDPERFALAYDALCRLQDRPGLLSDRTDRRVARMREMEKSVRRDMHKMKAFVRFREVGAGGEGRRQFVAWFEPQHHIVEPITGFFARRFADMDWVIATPRMTVSFREGVVSYDTTPRAKPDLEDPTEELWKTYFANIFNPARLKVKAMTSEMPKKYWKNMPEAALIPELIAGAEAKMREMAAKGPSIPPNRAAAISQRLQAAQARPVPEGGLDGLAASLSRCDLCPIGACATQAVPGEGPRDAEVMVVGEQPGDQEDLTGRVFVGPAGQLLDQAFETAGLRRDALYLTNAVKHFKYAPRGKRRIHQNPDRHEIEACKVWLEQELALVRPRLIVALGGTALRALTGDGAQVLKRRGGMEVGTAGVPILVTVHPSFVLRQPDALRAAAFSDFVADLRRIAGQVQAPSALRE